MDQIAAYLTPLTPGFLFHLLLEVLLEIGYRSLPILNTLCFYDLKGSANHRLKTTACKGALWCEKCLQLCYSPFGTWSGFAKPGVYTQNNTSEINGTSPAAHLYNLVWTGSTGAQQWVWVKADKYVSVQQGSSYSSFILSKAVAFANNSLPFLYDFPEYSWV